MDLTDGSSSNTLAETGRPTDQVTLYRTALVTPAVPTFGVRDVGEQSMSLSLTRNCLRDGDAFTKHPGREEQNQFFWNYWLLQTTCLQNRASIPQPSHAGNHPQPDLWGGTSTSTAVPRFDATAAFSESSIDVIITGEKSN